jgi:hypothetical protein
MLVLSVQEYATLKPCPAVILCPTRRPLRVDTTSATIDQRHAIVPVGTGYQLCAFLGWPALGTHTSSPAVPHCNYACRRSHCQNCQQSPTVGGGNATPNRMDRPYCMHSCCGLSRDWCDALPAPIKTARASTPRKTCAQFTASRPKEI